APRYPAHRLGLPANAPVAPGVPTPPRDPPGAPRGGAPLAGAPGDPAEDGGPVGYALACCMQLVEQDTQLPQARRQELAQVYRQQALTTLRQAVRNGYRDVARLKDDLALAPLR